jgi:predicted AAA+ superfamily ATPase
MFTRKIYPELKKHLTARQVTVLTGMRRTGKTTALKYLLGEIKSPNKIYFDLERLNNRDLFSQKNYEAIVQNLEQAGLEPKKKAYLFLDEIQLVKNIPSVIKYLYDNYPIKFVVTGSSSYYLKNLFSESLSGRKKIFELHPLSFGEFLDFKKMPHVEAKNFLTTKFNAFEYEMLRNYYEEFITFGGFPEVVLLAGAKQKKDLLFDILDSYIRIDIQALADFRNMENMEKLLKMLSGRVGSRIDYVKISKLSGIKRATVKNYMDFFEQTYMITRVSVLAKNPDREIVKAKKLYFNDNGLLNILAEISGGAKFENAVFNQLRHFDSVRYYATKNGQEIDFILGEKEALEAKETPLPEDGEKLKKLAGALKIEKSRLIGRFESPNFNNYIWGGEIR